MSVFVVFRTLFDFSDESFIFLVLITKKSILFLDSPIQVRNKVRKVILSLKLSFIEFDIWNWIHHIVEVRKPIFLHWIKLFISRKVMRWFNWIVKPWSFLMLWSNFEVILFRKSSKGNVPIDLWKRIEDFIMFGSIFIAGLATIAFPDRFKSFKIVVFVHESRLLK